jgi:enoyl-CoA hydratase/carnithine racemase
MSEPKTYEQFLFAVENRVAHITLNRPDRLNALTFEVYRELTDCFYDLRQRDDVDLVLIDGAGRGFCSGGDVEDIIGDLVNREMKEVLDFTRMTGELILNMRELDRPIVAAIDGPCAGAGAVIALAADFRILAEDAKISFLFVRVGLTGADMGAAFLLPRVVGTARATEILMLGEPVTADRAEAMGLANAVVPRAEVPAEARRWLEKLQKGPMYSIRMTKRMINAEWTMEIGAAIEAEAQAQALMLMGHDHREFLNSFREKRAPKFEGR